MIEPLGADLALCIGDGEGDRSAPSPGQVRLANRGARRLGAPLMTAGPDTAAGGAAAPRERSCSGGIEDPKASEIGSGAIVLCFRQFLADSMRREEMADEYDWLISDPLGPALADPPSAKMSSLSPRQSYPLDGESYGGVEDRHLIVPRRTTSPGPSRFRTRSSPTREKLGRELDRISVAQDWPVLDPERFLAARCGVWPCGGV